MIVAESIAERDAAGNLQEADHLTGLWAWRHPHQADGSVTYTELKGDIQLEHVDFGYVPEKIVLHDISLYARPGRRLLLSGRPAPGRRPSRT